MVRKGKACIYKPLLSACIMFMTFVGNVWNRSGAVTSTDLETVIDILATVRGTGCSSQTVFGSI